MVVFTCNNCGDSLQKPKVLKHYQFQCRNNNKSLTCVDCFKDFFGEEYVEHTKCITENERYGGKDYKAKPSANKGERKQQEWINVVQNVLSGSKDLSREERSFLQSISRHDNIPRKKAKFFNFVKNAVGHRVSMNVVESCWVKMESAFKGASETNESQPSLQNHKNNEELQVSTSMAENKLEENTVAENENNENVCRENGHLLNNTENNHAINGKDKEKQKTKKRELEEAESEEPLAKKILTENSFPTAELSAREISEIGKFSWKSIILEILGDREEISLKKLRKKVVARYLQHLGDSITQEKAISKFEKKINKISDLVLVDNKVKRA